MRRHKTFTETVAPDNPLVGPRLMTSRKTIKLMKRSRVPDTIPGAFSDTGSISCSNIRKDSDTKKQTAVIENHSIGIAETSIEQDVIQMTIILAL